MSEVETFEEGVRKDPDNPDLRFQLGKAYFYTGKNTEAMEALKASIRLKQDHAESHFYLAKVFDILKRYDEMIDAFQHAAPMGDPQGGRIGQMFVM